MKQSTTEDKNGDNSDNSSDQNTKHVPDINKQSLIFPEEQPPDKNIHSVLLDNNIKSHTVLFRFSDMVEALAHPCTNIIVPLTEIFKGTITEPLKNSLYPQIGACAT